MWPVHWCTLQKRDCMGKQEEISLSASADAGLGSLKLGHLIFLSNRSFCEEGRVMLLQRVLIRCLWAGCTSVPCRHCVLGEAFAYVCERGMRQRLGERVCKLSRSVDLEGQNVSPFTPVLDGEMLRGDVTASAPFSTFGRPLKCGGAIDHDRSGVLYCKAYGGMQSAYKSCVTRGGI